MTDTTPEQAREMHAYMQERCWIVRNRHTGIIVSTWSNEDAAWTDKDRRDAEWEHIEPRESSPLVVESSRWPAPQEKP